MLAWEREFSVEARFALSSDGRRTGVSTPEGGSTSESSAGITGTGGRGSAHAETKPFHTLKAKIKPKAHFMVVFRSSLFSILLILATLMKSRKKAKAPENLRRQLLTSSSYKKRSLFKAVERIWDGLGIFYRTVNINDPIRTVV